MRKFANLDFIVERQRAQKLGLSVHEMRKREREIDSAWRQAHLEGRNIKTEPFRKEDSKPKQVASKKPKIRNQAPEMRTVDNQQYWDGSQWVKLEEKEPVNNA